MRHKKVEKTFHYSELQAYFHQIHEGESSQRELACCETETMESEDMTEARRTQNRVKVNGKEFKSVAAAFVALGIALTKHQAFRKKLKAEKKAEFEGHEFELI